MADNVTIKFTADISDLQQGMQQATSAVETTTSALRGGAAQINTSFASLSQAYGSGAAKKIAMVRTMSDTEISLARQNEQVQYDIALNGVKGQVSLVKEQAQTAQISRQEELASLLALEMQREGIERQHLQFLQSTYQQGTVTYAATQRRIEELASQSALRRQEIERNGNQQIYAEYRRSFEQIGSSVSSSIMGMITGHLRLRDAARNILLQIIHGFIQAMVKMVADWLAGVAAQTASTTAGEAAKTAAVTAGIAARTGAQAAGSTAGIASTIGAVLKNIMASAGETFAGIFGFLAPVKGPAAAGPAAAGQATVLSVATGLASFATGAWSLPSDMIAQVHQGEMIVLAGPAASFRSMMASNSGVAGTVHVNHAVNFNVSAMDAQSVRQFLKGNAKQIMRTINESVRTGSHIGLSTGEFTYATTAHQGARLAFPALPLVPINTYYDTFKGGAFPKTDYAYSIDQLQAAFPSCTTVAVVCAWFGNSENGASCQIYPSTTYIRGAFTKWNGSSYVTDHWMVSSLTETSSGLIPISSSGGSFTYGGTPSDQSIVECIVNLKARGFRVVFYPFILMDSAGKPWRGRITYSPDVSSAASSAVAAFLGSATTSQFTRLSNTVSYAGWLLILLTGAWFFTMLICAWLLAESIYFLLVLSFAAWKQYAVRGGQFPARLTEVAKQFGITPSSPQ